jgi:cell division protein FtsZ
MIIGIGGAGRAVLEEYRKFPQQGWDCLAYAGAKPLALEAAFVRLNYEPLYADAERLRRVGMALGDGDYAAFLARVREHIDRLVEHSSAVVGIAGLGSFGGTSAMAFRWIAESAKRRQKQSVAIVSRPFVFEGSHRLGNYDRQMAWIGREFCEIREAIADDCIDRMSRPLTLQRAYRALDAVQATQVYEMSSRFGLLQQGGLGHWRA